jgi:predicted DNA-binding WGR domain protein
MYKLGFTEGNADKFWQIERQGQEVQLKWGRSGTAGQSQVKNFESEAAAEAFLQQQLKAKLKKGYQALESSASQLDTPNKSQNKTPPCIPEAKPMASTLPPEPAPMAEIAPPKSGLAPLLKWTPKLREKELVPQYYNFSYPGEVKVLGQADERILALKKLMPELEKHLKDSVWIGDSDWEERGKAARDWAISGPTKTVSTEMAAILIAVSRRRHGVDYLWQELGPVDCLQAWIDSRYIHSQVKYSSEYKKHVFEITQVSQPTPLSLWDLSNANIWALRTQLAQMEESVAQELIRAFEPMHKSAPLSLRLGLDWLLLQANDWQQADMREWLELSPSQTPELWPLGWFLWPWLRDQSLLDQMAQLFIAKAKDHADLWDNLSLLYEPSLFWLLERAGHAATKSLHAMILAGKRAATRKKAVAVLKLIHSEAALICWADLLKHKDAGKEAHLQLSAEPLIAVPILLQKLKLHKHNPEAETLLTGLLRSLSPADLETLKLTHAKELMQWLPAAPTTAEASELPPYFQPEQWLFSADESKSWPICKELPQPVAPAKMDFSQPIRESDPALRPYIYDKPPLTSQRDAEILERFAGFDYVMLHHLDWLSDPAALTFWNERSPQRWNPYDVKTEDLNRVAMRFGLAGLPGFFALFEKYPEATYPTLCYFDTPEVLPILLRGLLLSSQRAVCKTWFLRHPTTALRGLIPLCLNPAKGLKIEALRALRWLTTATEKSAALLSPAEVRALAAEFGPEAQTAFETLLTIDPLRLRPAKRPKLPSFWKPDQLPPVLLKSGERLPLAALDCLALTLMLDSPGLPYDGINTVKALCTPESLEAFAIGLFELWLADGGSLKHEWAFWGLAHWGGAEAVRQMVPRLEKWPGERSVQRALLGLDLLFAMENVENAWPELHRLSLKTRYPSVQDKAAQLMRKLAQENPDGAEGLGDRLVPKLGLDAQSSIEFDLEEGKRVRLQIGAGGGLEIWMNQAQKRTKMPNQGQPTALKRLNQAHKDLEKQIGFQKMRLERAMYLGRRWPKAAFERDLLNHPLLKPLLFGLVMGRFNTADELPQQCFCLHAAGHFVDLHGETVVIPDDAFIGLVHPLEFMPSLQFWRELWTSEERVQPFEQLERQVFVSPLADLAKTQLPDPGKVASGKVLALISQADWKAPKHSEGELSKELGRGLLAELTLEYHVWALKEYPEVEVFHVHLRRSESCGGVRLEQAHPIAYSELRRDLARLI